MNDELFERYLSNRLTGDDTAALKQLLAQDRGARARFVLVAQEWQLFGEATRHLISEGLMSETPRNNVPALTHGNADDSANTGPGHAGDAGDALHRRRKSAVRPAPVRRADSPWRWAAVTLVSGALAAGIIIALFVSGRATTSMNNGEQLATVVSADVVENSASATANQVGGLTITRAGRTWIPALGEPVMAGDQLNTTLNAVAAIRYTDETRLDIAHDSLVIMGAPGITVTRGKRVQVVTGAITADVAKQPLGQPFLFLTPVAQATVLGTRLTLTVTTRATRLEVEHGRVQLTRVSDGAQVEVASGQVAQVGDGAVFATRLADRQAEASGAIPSSFSPAPSTNALRRAGLTTTFFFGLDLTRPVFTRIDASIDFDLGLEPSPSHASLPGPVGAFSARWVGALHAPTSDAYRFEVRSDSGVRLWIADRLLIDAWTERSPHIHAGLMALEAGKNYPLRLEYVQPTSGMLLHLGWAAGKQRAEPIAPEYFSVSP